MPEAVALDGVTTRYGDVLALDGVSLSVPAGAAVALVGTNGAGKTTLFRLLVGHETPDAGSVRVAGRRPAEDGVRQAVGYLPEDAGFQPALTGREVLAFHARMRGVPADDREHRVARVLATVGLGEAAGRPVGEYSNGMNRRLGLGVALVGDPDVLLLDEPTASLDPGGVEAFHQLVAAVRDRTDITVLVSSHVLPEVERLCDRAAVLDDGRLVAAGPIDELRRAAGDRATVEATLADAAAVTVDGAEVVERDGDRLVLACPRDAVLDTLDRLREQSTVESVTVSEPSLDDAFHELVGGDPAVTLAGDGDGGGRP